MSFTMLEPVAVILGTNTTLSGVMGVTAMDNVHRWAQGHPARRRQPGKLLPLWRNRIGTRMSLTMELAGCLTLWPKTLLLLGLLVSLFSCSN